MAVFFTATEVRDLEKFAEFLGGSQEDDPRCIPLGVPLAPLTIADDTPIEYTHDFYFTAVLHREGEYALNVSDTTG